MLTVLSNSKSYKLLIPETIKEYNLNDIRKSLEHIKIAKDHVLVMNLFSGTPNSILLTSDKTQMQNNFKDEGLYLIRSNSDMYKDYDSFVNIKLSGMQSPRAIVLDNTINNGYDDIKKYLDSDKNLRDSIIKGSYFTNKLSFDILINEVISTENNNKIKCYFSSFAIIPAMDIMAIIEHTDYKSKYIQPIDKNNLSK